MFNDFFRTINDDLLKLLTGINDLCPGEMDLDRDIDIVCSTFKESLTEKFKNWQLGEIAGLLGKGGDSTTYAKDLMKSVAVALITKSGATITVSDTVAVVTVPFLIDELSLFFEEREKIMASELVIENLGPTLPDETINTAKK